MRRRFDFFVVLVLSFHFGSAARILIYNPLFGQSHVNFVSAIADALADDGHNLTLLTVAISEGIHFNNKRFDDVIFVDLPAPIKEMTAAGMADPAMWTFDAEDIRMLLEESEKSVEFMKMLCDATLDSMGNALDELRSRKFDLGMAEYFDGCGLGIFHQIGLSNYALLSSSMAFEPLAEAIGLPFYPAFVPGFSFSGTSEELRSSLFLRVRNAALHYASKFSYNALLRGSQASLDEHFSTNSPRLADLAAASSLVFTNSDPLIDYAAPTLHKVVPLGGLAHVKVNNLTKDWIEILNRQPRNVLISFGSVLSTHHMPDEMKASVLETVRAFPDVTFIWKYEKPEDETGHGIENLYKVAWTPQIDLLNSGRVSAFITHAGMGSAFEASYSGVPQIAVGIFGDQLRNAKMLEHHGSAVALSKKDLYEAGRLTEALRVVLDNDSFTENAQKLARLVRRRPFSPRELLLRNVAFVAEQGPLTRLAPISTKMSTLQLFFLDALLVLLGVGFILVILLIWFVRFARKRISSLWHAKKE